jgi:hypothetical protein
LARSDSSLTLFIPDLSSSRLTVRLHLSPDERATCRALAEPPSTGNDGGAASHTYHSLRETGSEKHHPSLPSAFLDQTRPRLLFKKARLRYIPEVIEQGNAKGDHVGCSPGFGGGAHAILGTIFSH